MRIRVLDQSIKPFLTISKTVCFLVVASAMNSIYGHDVYVAPDGSDDNPGTLVKPFATIAQARDAVRPLIATMTSDITIWIRGGRYHLNESIKLDDRDGGKGKHNVIYKNYKDEKPVIIGGVPVTGWTPYERGIMKADVGKDTEFWSLLVGDKLATMARERRWRDKGKVPKSARNLQVYGQMQWMSEYRRVVSIDTKTGKHTTEFPRSHYGGSPKYFQGSYTFIDEPGEWAVDSDSGILYYLPRSPEELRNVVRPTGKSVFQIRGRSDSQQVQNVVIEGLRLLFTDFNANMRCYAGITVDGYEYSGADWPNTLRTAIVAIENAHNIQVRYCDLSEAPINAVSIYGHATDNTVYGCRMSNLGYSGVYLAGLLLKKNNPCVNMRNTVKNCLIRNLTLGVNHPAGVYIYQSSDNKIQHNMIHTSNRYAVSIKGIIYGKRHKVQLKDVPYEKWYEYIHSNRNIISHNYVYDCVKNSSDSGAIESWGGGRDNVVDHNMLFDIYNGKAKNGWRSHSIFLDDGSSFWTVTNNVIWSTRGPRGDAALMLKAFENRVENNVFDMSYFSLGGIQAQSQEGHQINRNIFYANSPLKLYDDGKLGPEKDGTRRAFRFKKTSVIAGMDNNLYYNANGLLKYTIGFKGEEVFHTTLAEWRKTTKSGKADINSRVADPQFINAPARDYRLRETSPALDMGIKSIDMYAIGPLEDFPFAPEDDPLKTAFLKANGKDVYIEAEMDDTVKLQVTGRTKNWFVADLSKANIGYSIDDSGVATVSKDGVVTLKGKGRVCITAAVTLDGKTRSDEVVIYVGIARGAKQQSR